MTLLTIDPIGTFHTLKFSPYELPRQAGLQRNEGHIYLKKGLHFEQALEGLEGFDLIWVIFLFHRSSCWKPKVLPPRGGKKRGVFATRSPHRPNFIGMSCVTLESIQGVTLRISNHDLLDGSPILDIKPYLNYADSLKSARQGWLQTLPSPPEIQFEWTSLALAQLHYLEVIWNCFLRTSIEHRLSQSPVPYPNHRVKQISEQEYELAYRTWRVSYTWKSGVLLIHYLKSGYDQDTLLGKKMSRWNDVQIHQAFVNHFA